MAWPATPLDVEVSILLDGLWTDITAYVREDHKVTITRGRRQRTGLPMRGQCTMVLDNTDGRFSRFNPAGAWYGVIGKNTQLRVRVDNGGGYISRFHGYVPGWAPEWDPSENDQTASITAVGILDRLGRNKVVRSPLNTTMLGTSTTWTPTFYWPMEDRSGSTTLASGLPGGQPMGITGGVIPGASSDIPGAVRCPSFGVTAVGSGNITFAGGSIPGYAETGQWTVQLAAVVSGSTGINGPIEVYQSSGTVTKVQGYIDLTANEVRFESYAGPSGGAIATASDGFDAALVAGRPVSLALSSEYLGSGANDLITITLLDDTGTVLASASAASAGHHGRVSDLFVGRGQQVEAASYAHYAFITDPAFVVGVDEATGASAISGWAGEMAHERLVRLGAESGFPVGTASTVSAPMGAQLADTVLANVRDCQNADMGVLAEAIDGEGLIYQANIDLANNAAAFTLAYDQGQILPPWRPQDDDQEYRNDVTVSRPGGSSARATDEEAVALVGTYDTGPSANLYTDGQVDEHAGWLLHLGTTDELTWPAVRPNFYEHPSLLTDWLATNLGDQLWVTGHPSPLAPDTIRQQIEGYTEVYGSYVCEATIILSPASVHDIAEADDDILGRADTDGMVITTAIDGDDLSALLATTTPTSPLATTDAGDFPVDLRLTPDGRLMGEVITVSDIDAPTTITFGAAGTVTHASNASVTPGIPAGVVAGNLLLVLAAIRNSGTGIPLVPDGYTRMPVFPATSNVQLFGKVAVGGDAAPLITFSGGVANADTSAQMCRIAGAYSSADEVLVVSNALLNASAQDIAYPALNVQQANNIVFYLGWKADDWTSVASPGTEIGEPDTVTGDDQGIVWAYTIQTAATNIAAGSFAVTGGAGAISRGAVCAIRSNVQLATISARSVNGVSRIWPARTQIQLATRAVPGY